MNRPSRINTVYSNDARAAELRALAVDKVVELALNAFHDPISMFGADDDLRRVAGESFRAYTARVNAWASRQERDGADAGGSETYALSLLFNTPIVVEKLQGQDASQLVYNPSNSTAQPFYMRYAPYSSKSGGLPNHYDALVSQALTEPEKALVATSGGHPLPFPSPSPFLFLFPWDRRRRSLKRQLFL